MRHGCLFTSIVLVGLICYTRFTRLCAGGAGGAGPCLGVPGFGTGGCLPPMMFFTVIVRQQTGCVALVSALPGDKRPERVRS